MIGKILLYNSMTTYARVSQTHGHLSNRAERRGGGGDGAHMNGTWHTWTYAIHSICLRESLPGCRSRATSIDRPKHIQIQHNIAQLAMVFASTHIAYNVVSVQTGSNWARDRKSLDCNVINWISLRVNCLGDSVVRFLCLNFLWAIHGSISKE